MDGDGALHFSDTTTLGGDGLPSGLDIPGKIYRIAVAGSMILPGDIDHDGAVTVRDATFSLRWAFGIGKPAGRQGIANDVNGDGRLDVVDVGLILRKAIGG